MQVLYFKVIFEKSVVTWTGLLGKNECGLDIEGYFKNDKICVETFEGNKESK